MEAREVLQQYKVGRRDFSGEDFRNIDISGADLKDINLEEVDLSGANLSGADLQGANLRNTVVDEVTKLDRKWSLVWKIVNRGCEDLNLREVDLSGANLNGIDLSEINLRKANLSRTNLSQVNLREATLKEASLIGADLSGANLREAQCQKANFSQANLSKTNCIDTNFCQAIIQEAELVGAIFYESNLSYSNLSYSNLIKTDLSQANLRKATLIKADLSKANLSQTNLEEANLSQAILREANLSQADLDSAILNNIDLTKANLSKAKLFKAKFIQAKLIGANLSIAECRKANFSESNLREANLRQADFSEANLTQSDLRLTLVLGTDFDRAELTGACLEDWHYNSETKLNNVICEYFYLKANKKERCPYTLNKFFSTGEFTKRFSKILEIIDFIFRNGENWYEQEIEIMKKTIMDREEEIKEKDRAIKSYEERLLDVKYFTSSNRLTTIINKVESNSVAEHKSQGDTYNQSGNFGIGHMSDGAIQREAKVAGVLNEADKRSLAEIAEEIQQLLRQLETQNPTATDTEKQTFVTLAIPQNKRQRAVSALKSGSKEILRELLDNPYVNIGIAIIEGWQNPE
ncbi:pentapeptide repeat-containing protein [Lusitaniella coriacea]|uniref:pentapeptide repeat-containing protein n=1 Tax=Lusitaniella coriacea TaxID=1983105 RepID=UPI003CEDF8E0